MIKFCAKKNQNVKTKIAACAPLETSVLIVSAIYLLLLSYHIVSYCIILYHKTLDESPHILACARLETSVLIVNANPLFPPAVTATQVLLTDCEFLFFFMLIQPTCDFDPCDDMLTWRCPISPDCDSDPANSCCYHDLAICDALWHL